VYEGAWKRGERDGEGAMRWPDGVRFTGTWVGGRRWGAGTLVLADGGEVRGVWRDDELERRVPAAQGAGETPVAREPAPDLATGDAAPPASPLLDGERVDR
ncbi:MAG: hypothetical protein KC560_08880, partial [Myxococcales bacterium]|nr:hypothetical protein [Myxococcales bacterium]